MIKDVDVDKDIKAANVTVFRTTILTVHAFVIVRAISGLLKFRIYRTIYYSLRPTHFLSNGLGTEVKEYV